MKILIAGESPFVEEIRALCVNAGHQPVSYLVEDFLGAIRSGYALGEQEGLNSAEIILECHHESASTKRELLAVIADVVPMNALILTSALSVSTTEAASWIPRPARVVGFGILPPLPDAGMVEIAGGLLTSDDSLERASTFWSALNQTAVSVKDSVGLVRGRVVCGIINEAVTALQEGVAEASDIDTAMKLGTNYPHGPLEWADHLGLDTVLGVMTGLFTEYGEDRYRPAPLLRHKVLAGQLGKKSGQGFYEYSM